MKGFYERAFVRQTKEIDSRSFVIFISPKCSNVSCLTFDLALTRTQRHTSHVCRLFYVFPFQSVNTVLENGVIVAAMFALRVTDMLFDNMKPGIIVFKFVCSYINIRERKSDLKVLDKVSQTD